MWALGLSTIYYLLLAQLDTNQTHSVVHAVNAFAATTWIFWRNGLNLFSWTVPDQIAHIHDPFLMYVCEHSLAYFIADSFDIIWSDQLWRRVYLWHHVFAAVGISTIYLGVNYSIFAIWCLEIGGIVHHLKRLAPSSLTYLIYIIVYTVSRIYFAVILSSLIFVSPTFTNAICFLTSLVLTVQNFIWLRVNIAKMF